jgi:hypothetical protein
VEEAGAGEGVAALPPWGSRSRSQSMGQGLRGRTAVRLDSSLDRCRLIQGDNAVSLGTDR